MVADAAVPVPRKLTTWGVHRTVRTPMPTDSLPPPSSRGPRDELLPRLQPLALELAQRTTLDEWTSLTRDFRRELSGSDVLPDAGELQVALRVGAIPSEAYLLHGMRPLGDGGLNSTYLAELLATGHRVTLRIPADPESVMQDLERQQHIALVHEHLERLPEHRGVPSFLGMAQLRDDTVCEVFCFAPGRSLVEMIQERPLNLAEFSRVAVSAAHAISHLHRHGLVHCDIKPANFCVEYAASPRGERRIVLTSIIDFDLLVSREGVLRQIALGHRMGTLSHMPPETFGADLPVDEDERARMAAARDIYAFGITLYTMLLGRRPSGVCADQRALYLRKASGAELELEFPASVPGDLQELLRSMVRSDWWERPTLDRVIAQLAGLRIVLAAHGAEQPKLEGAPQVDLDETWIPPTVLVTREPIGPFVMHEREFLRDYRRPDTGELVTLARLEDEFGEPYIGIPTHVATEAEAMGVKAERTEFLRGLNDVRMRHARLFPGLIDIVPKREEDGSWTVWTIRPMLTGARSLSQYVERDAADAARSERVAILRRVAESLAALEEAGYVHPGISASAVYFVRTTHVEGSTMLVEPCEGSYRDHPPFRQETMDTVFARRADPERPDDNAQRFLALVADVGLVGRLTEQQLAQLERLPELGTWAERVDALRQLEAELKAG